MKKLVSIMKDESAQGMLEYVMLLAVVAAIILVFKGKIVALIGNLTDKVGNDATNVMNSNGPG